MDQTRCFYVFLVSTWLLMGVTQSTLADGKEELTDAEMESVVAAGNSLDETGKNVLIDHSRSTRAGTRIDVDGSFEVLDAPRLAALGSLNISDSAQGNLSSLININAVNSSVNVLLNLNIAIDSNIGALNQSNLNNLLPNTLPISSAGR